MTGRRDPAGGRWPLAGDPRLIGAPRGIDPRRVYGPLWAGPVREVRPQGPVVRQQGPGGRRSFGVPGMSADPQHRQDDSGPARHAGAEQVDVPVDEDPQDAVAGGDGGSAGNAGNGTGGGSGDPEIAALGDIATLAAERDEYLSALQRLKADFDNYRKRIARQEVEQAARAAGDLVAKLLPVVDNLDLAWSHLGEGRPADEVSEEARALFQSRQQLLDVLSREGLERVDAVGVAFDPTVHDAVAHVPADACAEPAAVEATGEGCDGVDSGDAAAPVGVVVDGVMRAGYRFGGRVIRPAMVRVRG